MKFDGQTFVLARRYDIAFGVVCVVIASLSRWFFLPDLGIRAPFILFYPAVVVAALFGSLRAGLFATVLSAVVATYAWMPPLGSFHVLHLSNAVEIATFLGSGAFIAWFR